MVVWPPPLALLPRPPRDGEFRPPALLPASLPGSGEVIPACDGRTGSLLSLLRPFGETTASCRSGRMPWTAVGVEDFGLAAAATAANAPLSTSGGGEAALTSATAANSPSNGCWGWRAFAGSGCTPATAPPWSSLARSMRGALLLLVLLKLLP